jgi:uncharacterized membrane protein YfcA
VALTIIVVAIFSFMAEYTDSSLGMGYGTTLTPLLLLLGFSSGQVVPAILVQELISGAVASGSHHIIGNVDFRPRGLAARLGVVLGICGLLGGAMAATVALHLPEATIKAITGIIVMAMGLLVIGATRLNVSFSWWRAGGLGLVAAVNKGFMGGGYGPVMTAGQVVIGVAPHQAVAITSLSEAMTCIGGLAAYFLGGATLCWPLVIGMVTGGALAAMLSAPTIRALPTAKLRTALAVACFALGSLTLIKVLLK